MSGFRLPGLALLFFAALQLSAQYPASFVEAAVDDADYLNILEHYSYDSGMASDPEFYGEWPWRGPHVLYKLSYSSVRGQRVPAYLAIPKEKVGEKLPVVVLMHGWNLFWGKNEDWVQEWIPLLTAQGYAKFWHRIISCMVKEKRKRGLIRAAIAGLIITGTGCARV